MCGMPSAPHEYVGPVGHEKKAHQTHFGVSKKKELDGASSSMFEWVEYATGRYKLVRKRSNAATTVAEEHNGVHAVQSDP